MLDVSPWGGLVLIEEMTEGNRNQVWQAEFEGAQVAVRCSRRSAASLEWELDLAEGGGSNSYRLRAWKTTSQLSRPRPA